MARIRDSFSFVLFLNGATRGKAQLSTLPQKGAAFFAPKYQLHHQGLAPFGIEDEESFKDLFKNHFVEDGYFAMPIVNRGEIFFPRWLKSYRYSTDLGNLMKMFLRLGSESGNEYIQSANELFHLIKKKYCHRRIWRSKQQQPFPKSITILVPFFFFFG